MMMVIFAMSVGVTILPRGKVVEHYWIVKDVFIGELSVVKSKVWFSQV